MTTSHIKPYRVLTFDGGGVRGLYTATLLWELVRLYRKRRDFRGVSIDIGAAFDLICGTSTGSILACGLATGVDLKKLMDFYRDHGPRIFPRPAPKRGLGLGKWTLRHRRRPSGNAEVLEEQLRREFQHKTLGQVHEERGVCLCVPAVNMAMRTAKVFKTPHCERFTNDRDYSLVDVCLASSAAPIILPLRPVQDPDDCEKSTCFADGGLWANNPAMVGLLEALELADPGQRIEILSLSTCAPATAKVLSSTDAEMGILDWGVGIGVVEAILDAQASGTAHMARILGRRLTALGQDVRVHRPEASAPSAEQAAELGVDRATPDALELLATLAKTDAQALHSRATNRDDDLGKFLDDVMNGFRTQQD